MKSKFAAILLSLLVAPVFAGDTNGPALIPLPEKMECREGAFQVRPETRVLVNAAAKESGEYLAERLRKSTGYRLRVDRATGGRLSAGDILLTTARDQTNAGEEGYHLDVTPKGVIV